MTVLAGAIKTNSSQLVRGSFKKSKFEELDDKTGGVLKETIQDVPGGIIEETPLNKPFNRLETKTDNFFQKLQKKQAVAAFNENISRNNSGQFISGSNASAGKAAQSVVNASYTKKFGIGALAKNAAKNLVRGVGATALGVVIGTGIDVFVEHKPLDESLGKNIVVGIAGAVVTSAIVAGLVAGGVVAGAGIALAAVGIVVGIVVGVTVGKINDEIIRAHPAIGQFETMIGDGLINVGKAAMALSPANIVVNVVSNAGKWFNDATNYIQSNGGVFGSAQKILTNKDPLHQAADALLTLHSKYDEIKRINNQLIPDMQDVLTNIKTSALNIFGWTGITIQDIDDIVMETHSDVEHHIDVDAVQAVNKRIDEKKEQLDIIANALKQTANHALDQDEEWSRVFGDK